LRGPLVAGVCSRGPASCRCGRPPGGVEAIYRLQHYRTCRVTRERRREIPRNRDAKRRPHGQARIGTLSVRNGHLGLGHILWLVEVQLSFGMGVFALRDAHRTKSMYTTAKLPLRRQNSSRRSGNEKPLADVVMECIEFTLEHLHRQDRTEGMSSTNRAYQPNEALCTD
jgi:hypothetical protein